MGFSAKDPIFKLTEAITAKVDAKCECVFCERDLSNEEPKHCQFCGNMACLRCCHKNRKFQPKPGSQDRVTGLCCRVCDRKFVHLQMKSIELEHVVFLKEWEISE